MRSLPAPFVDRLRADLHGIEVRLQALLDASSIMNVDPNTPGSPVLVLGAATWAWAPEDAKSTAARIDLLRDYDDWFVRVELLFDDAIPAVEQKLSDADEFVRRWVQREGGDHSVPATIAEAKDMAARELAAFRRLLDIAAHKGDSALRLVPDTSSAIDNPDFGSYQRSVGTDTFEVHLLPTVLAELDDLKHKGAPEVRDAARDVLRRLKGLRNNAGMKRRMTLTKSIAVCFEHRDGDPAELLSWLDRSVNDDRILAGALRLQGDHPAATVMLVTSDLNLQNKAHAAGMPYIETPAAPATLMAKLTIQIVPRIEAGSTVWFAELHNAGPSTAREITYGVGSLPDSPPPRTTAGPWPVDQLAPGEHAAYPIFGFFSDVLAVSAAWADNFGQHDESWTVPFPEEPDTPRARLNRGRR